MGFSRMPMVRRKKEVVGRTVMIKHSFAQEPEALKLFEGGSKFSQFKYRLKKLSQSLPKSNPVRWGRHVNQDENYI